MFLVSNTRHTPLFIQPLIPPSYSGIVQHVAVVKGDAIDAGDLVALIRDDLPDITDDEAGLRSVDGAAMAAAAASA